MRANRFLLAVLALGMLFPGLAAAQGTLTVSDGGARAGQTVTVPVTLSGVNNVTDLQFDIAVDTSVLTFVSLTKGSGASAASKDFATAPTPGTSGGTSFRVLVTSPTSGAGATSTISGEVASVTFRINAQATDNATSNVTLSGIVASDAQANSVTVNGDNGVITVQPGPRAPTVTAISLSASTITSANAGPHSITVTFSEAIRTSPAPTVSFQRSGGSGTAPSTLTLSAVGQSTTTFTATFTATFANNGTYSLNFSATDQNDNLALTTQPSSGNTITINLPVPPDTAAPTVSVTAQPGTVTAAGNVTITATLTELGSSGQAPSGLNATVTAVITGPTGSPVNGTINLSGVTAGANSGTATGTRAVAAQAGVNGQYTVTVTARDQAGNTATGTANFTVNITTLPTVTARATIGGQTSATVLPGIVALDASGTTFSNVTGVTYSWARASGPTGGGFAGATNTPRVFFNATTAGTYTFTVTVTSTGATPAVSSTANVTVNVINVAPFAVTRPAIFVRLPATGTASVNLDASQSFDPNEDAITYSWANTAAATAAALTNNTSAVATLTIQGGQARFVDTVTLTVTAGGQSSTAQVLVIGSTSAPPRANAGVDQTFVTTAASLQVRLYGRDSVDPDNQQTTANLGTALSFSWTLESFTNLLGQAGTPTAPTFDASFGATSVDPLVTLSTEGIYTFRLTVTSRTADGSSSTARVKVRLVRQATGERARAAISATSTDGSVSTSAASVAAGRPTTIFSVTLQPSQGTVVTLSGAGSRAGTAGGTLAYRWSVVDLTGEDESLLSTTTAAQTQITIPGTVAGSVDVILNVFENGRPGVPARARLIVNRTNNTAPRITDVFAVATNAGTNVGRVSSATTAQAEISAGGVLPSITITINAADAETAGTALTYEVFQLVQSELTETLTKLGVDPSDPSLGNNGGTTPRLAAFAQGQAGIGSNLQRTATGTGGLNQGAATVQFSVRPEASSADAEAVGGTYVFLVRVTDASGSDAEEILQIPVIDRRAAGRATLRLAIPGATASETAEGVVYSFNTQLNSSGQLILDATSTIDRKTGFRVSSADGTPTATFTGFIRWSQASGPTDFGPALTAINARNGNRGQFRLALSGAAAGNYLFKSVFDNGQAQDQSQIALTAAAFAAAGGGGTVSGFGDDDGGLCALSKDATTSSRVADILLLLLPLAMVLMGRFSLRLQEARR